MYGPVLEHMLVCMKHYIADKCIKIQLYFKMHEKFQINWEIIPSVFSTTTAIA